MTLKGLITFKISAMQVNFDHKNKASSLLGQKQFFRGTVRARCASTQKGL